MSRRCELTGVSVLYGNKVSHSERKTRRRFEPNMKEVRFLSNLTGSYYRFRVNVACIRTVEKMGGLDSFMQKASPSDLSDNARAIRKSILKKLGGSSNEA
jgi:large subunit ribosomal protein L28